MDTEDRLKWLETRISTSLRPRADELRSLFSRDESRATLIEFLSNDEAHCLFVFAVTEDQGGGLRVSLGAPKRVLEKCICFTKTGSASQLHAGNFDDGVTCVDWSEALPHADMFVRDVFLPLLCTDTDLVSESSGLSITPDKLMDILHRLLGNIEVTRGVSDGKVTLPLPCIEVLAEAAAFHPRQPAVVHVLESAVVGWIRQIRNLLRHDALATTKQLSVEQNEPIRPHHEVQMWEKYIEHMTSLLDQLNAPVATDILMNLNHANSTYAQSFGEVQAEIERALEEAKARLQCFSTVLPWIHDMYRTPSLGRMLKVFPPLLQTVLLIWKHSDYYHAPKPFAQLLKMLSNEVVARARSLVGENPFDDTHRSYTALKDALRLCAAFRGTYLDFKETANAYNSQKVESTVITMARLRPKDKNVLFRTKMYGPAGYQQWLSRSEQRGEADDDDEQWLDSAWPPRNNKCFAGLSRFVERCNDLLDLVETTRHFLTLEQAALVGGAGTRALDALISDIHQIFTRTIRDFTSHNRDVLTIDDKQHFEKAFFHYRSVIKTLEHRLAGVLRRAIRICPNAMSHLRVLEVFEGISARELLQRELQTENNALVMALAEEFRSVKKMFESSVGNVPVHGNMPPTVGKLVWVRALKERVSVPMAKVREVCAHALENDLGWQLRDSYTDVMNELERYETRLLTSWSRNVDEDLRNRLKQPVLISEPLESARKQSESRLWQHNSSRASMSNDESDEKSDTVSGLKVNMDARLLEMLRDVHYLQRSPHNVPVPAAVRALLRATDSSTLQSQCTRMSTIVSKHNHVVQRMQEYEQMLFESKMRRIDDLISEGTEVITWGSADLEDFIEKTSSFICDDVYAVLTRIHSNWERVKQMSKSWSEGALDIFTSHMQEKSTKSLNQLITEQNEKDDQYRRKLVPAGLEIHQLLQNSFETLMISAASPAWQLYTAQMDAMVLMSLKSSIITSLDAMYATISNMDKGETGQILEVRLELVEQTVSFSPPLDRSAAVDNVDDAISSWLTSFLERSKLIKRLTDPTSHYSDFLSNDSDVWEVVEAIQNEVQENVVECTQHLSLFDNYKFLWVQDVQQSFKDFLNGRPSPNPLRASKQSHRRPENASRMTTTHGQRSRFSLSSPDTINEAERAFLTSQSARRSTGDHRDNVRSADDNLVVPGLSDFDEEIGIYRMARDDINSLPDRKAVGWIMFNFEPIKQVLTTYASKWMWTFVKYLSDQVTDALDTLADFLARTEPEIESITGEERDTASFMKMMRLFNEVSAQQQDMDGRFSVMQRTVDLLEKYEMRLPNETQEMFRSAPDRWNHLKTKVSLAKQRLGPRIQEESEGITHDLLRFSERVQSLASDLLSSEVFSRDCSISAANETIDNFARRLRSLQTEAQDLIELQELLETAVVDFSVLPQHQRDLRNLKIVWHHVKMVQEEQRDWKLKHWQRIDTKQLHQAMGKQRDIIQSLTPEVTDWDVYSGMIASINVIEQCLPLVEDLNHPAMRTRHWKQLVRVTGGLLQTDTDSLRKMVLGDLLELGLQKHADEVKAIVQRAVKDLTIESSLKTCEEVWLSKIFELKPHTRSQSKAVGPDVEAGSEVTGSEMMPHALLQTYEGSRTGGTRTKSMKSAVHSRSSDKTGGSVSKGKGGGRTSVLSLPVSLLNLVDDPSPICLLKNVKKILSELEHHQVELNRMQSNSAIGSFLDEVNKWQKRLHLIEAVLNAWVTVQTKWVQLDEVYSGADVRTALAHEANMFAVMSKDFRLLMRATEKNTNVLQSCSRKGLLPMLEKMDVKMEQCRQALLGNLERRRQRFPRFYFLSPEDVMNIVCYGYDLNAVNRYLCKIFPHLGCLVFDEEQLTTQNLAPSRNASAGAKKKFKVRGVMSTSGEVMTLHKSLFYEGPMSLWLPQLLTAIQVTIQEQLHIALGNDPRPAQVEQTLRSAGASKIRISRPSSAVSQRSGGSHDLPKVNVSPPQTDVESGRSEPLPPLLEKPSDMANQLGNTLSSSVPTQQISWTLDNSTQVVLLATTVQMNERLNEAMKAISSGDQSAMTKVADAISDSLHAAVIMLKGIEDEKAVRMKSARRRIKKKEKQDDRNDEPDASESIGAPSTRSSLDDELYEGENFNDDAIVPDSGRGPIETMQSLLFTDQVRSGSRGTRGELDLLSQKPEETGDSTAESDCKLLLYPSQIRKISGLIGILTQQRDACHSLRSVISKGTTKPDSIFEWQARLKHVYDKEEMSISVHAMDWSFEYGYEYHGSCSRYIVSPSCDRILLSMCQALKSNMGVALTPSSSHILSELSYQLGRALYHVLCTETVDHFMLGDLFKGIAETGCWICLQNLDTLKPSVLSVTGQLSAEVHRALMAGKPSITLMSEEVSLSPLAACFVTLSETTKCSDGGVVSLNRPILSTAIQLPEECRSHFRIINGIAPDRQAMFEVQLLAQGFTQAGDLARKLTIFLDLCGSLLATLPFSDSRKGQPSAAEGFYSKIAYKENLSTSGSLMSHVISSSGSVLDVLMREQLELKQEDRDTIATKTRKFANIWRHRSSLMSSSGGLASSLNDDIGAEGLPGGILSTSSIAPSVDPATQEVIQVNQDRELIESDAETMRKMEEIAIATALRNILCPRLPIKEDRSLVATFVVDLWPDADVDFGLEEEEGMNLEVSIPSRPFDSESTPFQPTKPADPDPVNEVEAAIAIATTECHLAPSVGFQSRVAQLAELMESTRSVLVYGSAGCGKSKCVDVYTQAQKQLGYNVTCRKVYVNALDSRQKLFGYFERETREWKDGMMQGLLRPHCLGQNADTDESQNPARSNIFLLHVDGVMSAEDADIFMQLLRTDPIGPSWLALPNNERICIPLDVRVAWELEDLSSLAPSDPPQLALLGFNNTEVTWKVILSQWVDNLPKFARSVTHDIVMRYLPSILEYLIKFTTPPHLTSSDDVTSRLRMTTRVSPAAMTNTFCKLVDCLLPQQSDLTATERERYVGYAAFWAFGGTLEADSRGAFASWWCEYWPDLFPAETTDPWSLFVDPESRNFARWEDHLPQFSGFNDGYNAFVHTPEASQLMHIVGALMDAGHPSVIVGPLGCGKSAILRERVNNVSSGEVAEVLSLFVHCNRLTEAGTLWARVSEQLEWKHGVTYTPRGNKKLLCMIDDINLTRPLGTEHEGISLQSACELIRQHLDAGGVRNPLNYKWQQVSNTTYVTTVNPNPTGNSCRLTQRMTRHFSVFSCPYPNVATQYGIFSTMLQSHFLPNLGSSAIAGNPAESNVENEKILKGLISDLTMITVELQDRLRHMYLPVPDRALYNFALCDLERIFRNLMLSLTSGCHQKDLLLLWRHECDWTYGHRMVSGVDRERYEHALNTSVRKYLTENKYLPIVLAPKQPSFSSVRELDGGLVTAGRHVGRNSTSMSRSEVSTAHVTDYYKPVTNQNEVHHLLTEALKEYNKVNVQMRLSLYEDSISLICRLARVMQSHHDTAHSLLFGEGCPVLAALMVRLASHLGGFKVISLPPLISPLIVDPHAPTGSGPSSLPEEEKTILTHFKRNIVQLYKQAGVKGEKIVFMMHDDKSLTDECLAVVEELVRHGAISHLFTPDEQTTIANSVRSDVTAAGLAYSKDVAWNFFLSTVTRNLRVVVVCSRLGQPLMAKSLEFASLFNRMNSISLRHWSHEQLVSNALYHFSKQDLTADDTVVTRRSVGRSHWVMDRRRQENIAHLLANIHVAVKIKDGDKYYKIPGHVSNYAYEKLVERFLQLYNQRRQAVKESQLATESALENIDRESTIAEALQKELDREKQVLTEHKAGTLQLLAQIGQDMVIMEQQVSAVKRQVKRIRHLKKTLPEYQVAHERAVFKAAAIVADTKKIVQEISVQELSELRSLQKPDGEVEDLMAAIIMILKSPNSDVTWSKGAKRQMANLDRFLDELSSFDEIPMPMGTLETLESFWENENFTPENLTTKACGNTAAGSLLKWVQGVVRYHTIMITKVKPLHTKVQETSSSIGDAEHKLRQLESKKDALEARLHDLADGFEQATVDKNRQEEKRKEMEEHLRVAAKFRQVLTGEHHRCCAVLDSYEDRLEWVVGSAVLAAGFATYLSPYPFMFRRMMLTADWAQCLVEKGIPLVFDSTDPVKGHVIEFMMDVNDPVPDPSPRNITEGDTMLNAVMEAGRVDDEGEQPASIVQSDVTEAEVKSDSINPTSGLPPVTEETDADNEQDDATMDGADDVAVDQVQPEVETTIFHVASFTPYTAATLPYISNEEYQHFLGSLIKILAGNETLQDWMTKDFAHHQLHNAAIIVSSWQRPPLLLDPYLVGVDWCAVHLRNSDSTITPVNLSSKVETSSVTTIEKSILGGHTLMLMDCEHQAGPLVRPLIHHANTSGRRDEKFPDEHQTIRFLERRLLCPDTFRLYLTTNQMTAAKIHPDIVAATQLISYLPSTETLQEELLLRALSRVRPDICRERLRVARAVRQHRHSLAQLDSILCERLVTGNDPKAIENSTKFLSKVVELKASISAKLTECEELFTELNNLTEELFPIAQRAALLYSICRAIPALNIHYQVHLPYFFHLFDSSVGSEFETDEEETKAVIDVEVIHPFDVEEQRKKALEKRKASLRLGSAKKTIAKFVENMETTPEDDEQQQQQPTPVEDEEENIPTEEPSNETEDETESSTESHVVVPEVMELPTLEYTSFQPDKVKEIVDGLTERVFASIYSSVYPEHRLHVTALTLLNVQSEENDDKFSDEELVLLVHGNPGFGRTLKISLADFECPSPIPDWMPADRWEDVLALSILPGAIEGICVRVAESSELWRCWYEEQCPELKDFPPPQDDVPELSEFLRLLLIRTLRPDRYEPALKIYVDSNIRDFPLAKVVDRKSVIDADTMFKDVANTLGILLLLPESEEEMMSRVPIPPTEAIKRLAEKYKVTVESVTLGDGYRQEATRCIDTALNQDSWALIHGLHLAPDRFFEDLQIQLARVGNISRQDDAHNGATVSSQGGHFQVWLTSKPSKILPSILTQYLYKLSWDALLHLVAEDCDVIEPPSITCSSFKSSLISTLSKIPEQVMTQWKECKNERLLYVICLAHSVMLARHCFGWHGSNKVYALQDSTLVHAMEYAMKENRDNSVLKNIYTDVIETTSDQVYYHQVFDGLLHQINSGQGEKFVELNGVRIPVPPLNVAPSDYATWLAENISDDWDATSGLSISSIASTWQSTQQGDKLLTFMQDLFHAVQLPGYESSLLSPGNRSDVIKSHLTLNGLQTVLDLCSERLPPLLELGEIHENRLKEFDFLYHRPSVLSSGNPDDIHMPESIGFVLLQECIWFNQCLCKVRQQLYSLRSQLFVTSDYRLSKQLAATATALAAEEVPESWQHVDELLNTHVLLTWLDDVMRRYTQMRSWVKSGMVPVDGKTSVGNLSSVWLGGLANPGALLTALCQEKAALHDVTLSEIKISCSVWNASDHITEQEAGICLENVRMHNGKWDSGKGITIDDCDVLLPIVYFYPSLISEGEKTDLVEYPVYMNLARQRVVCHLPLPSSDTSRYSRNANSMLHATDCFLTLQSGPDLTNREVHKSRAYLARKRREDWARVSPAVSEMMSRSGTRMSSHPSGPRMSVTSLPEQKAGSVTKGSSPVPYFGSHQQLSVTSQKSLSQRSLTSHASSPTGLIEPEDQPQPLSPRIPNGDIPHKTNEPAQETYDDAPQEEEHFESPRSEEHSLPPPDSDTEQVPPQEGRTLLQAILDDESDVERSTSSHNSTQ